MPKTLLLADDSVTIQKVVGITFANEDVELVTVDNGDDALVRARQIKPDLVLADIGMPGLDGYALCSAIRKDPNLAHTPVLLLTGTFETYDEERARQVGANGHISKPFEAQALVDRVRALLAQSAAAPAPRSAPPTRPILTTPAPAPAAPAAQSAPQAPPRPRPELPPLPGAGTANAPRAAKPRATSTFEFEVPPEPSVAPPAAAEPLWEAEPVFEAMDDAPARRAFSGAPLGQDAADAPTPSPDAATRLFAPGLLDEIEPPAEPVARELSATPPRADFSFEDLDFEEPTAPPGSQTQIFGESSGPLDAQTVLSPRVQITEPVRAFEEEEITAPSQALAELELGEVEPEIEAERLDEADPFAEPFSADTSAALAEPEFADFSPASREPAPAHAATRLLPTIEMPAASDDTPEFEGDMLDVEPLPEVAMPEPPPELDAWSDLDAAAEPDPRPTAPMPTVAPAREPSRPVAQPVIDPALLSQALEKVAWEAFGSLSEQVVNEVRKRVEAVVWEVVPQMCERLIREEIARMKADLPE